MIKILLIQMFGSDVVLFVDVSISLADFKIVLRIAKQLSSFQSSLEGRKTGQLAAKEVRNLYNRLESRKTGQLAATEVSNLYNRLEGSKTDLKVCKTG